MGYFLLSPHVPMADAFNVRWDLFSIQSHWKLRFKVVWSSFLEPKQSFLGWSLLHQGLPIGIRRQYLGVPNPLCAFCNQPEDFLHVF